jgi:pimeloyl-ACP methyl ester carboxylesterase
MTEPISTELQGADCRLAVWEWPNPGAPTLVMVHGIQDFALSLSQLAETLSRHYRVVAYDLRGHGDSDKPGVYTMPHHLADLHALLFQLEVEKPILLGHSLGSQIVTQYAGIFDDVPRAVVSLDGLGPPVARIVLADDDLQWKTQEGIQSLLRPPSHGRPMIDLEDATERFLRFHPRMEAELAAGLVSQGTEPHPSGGLQWKWDPRVTSVGLTALPELTEQRWGWVRCPTLLATAGEVDEFFMRRMGLDQGSMAHDTAEIVRRAALFRQGHHVEIADAGHHLHYDQPSEVARVVLGFLETT